MPTLNLGIVAHVDAGKTTLTERLLHTAGVIAELGSVDRGTTQTDTLDLERRRGITIRAAVVSFRTDDGTVVNLIDTPGHPDFIAEVDRSLGVLDGAVLVVSAVEGVQAQTVVLMRALRRLDVPTIVFVNKTDRRGADPDRVIRAIRARIAPHEPIVCGSALTGDGVDDLVAALTKHLPAAATTDDDAPLAAAVFKIERSPRTGEKVAYLRVFDGRLHTRQRLDLGDGRRGTVTALDVFDGGPPERRREAPAASIVRAYGLRDARVGDIVGRPTERRDRTAPTTNSFAPPTLETAVIADDPAQKPALHLALRQLAEQDPLIDLRQDDERQELHLSLYGEVQKEVIQQTIAAEHGIALSFRETTTICIERIAGTGHAVRRLRRDGNPYLATLGLGLEPPRRDHDHVHRVTVDLDGIDVTAIPLYVYKTVTAFRESLADYVCDALDHGPHGWRVEGAHVTVTECGYVPPGTKAAHYRKLTPILVAEALQQAGTHVCEPIHRFRIDAPADTRPALLRAIAVHHAVAVAVDTTPAGDWCTIDGDVRAADVHRLRAEVQALTRGEGVLEAHLDRYDRTSGG